MIWNNFGEQFYIWGGNNKILSGFILLLYPVYMPLLFTIAGISSRFALQKGLIRSIPKNAYCDYLYH